MADLFGFIEWASQTKTISKHSLKKIEKEANYYIAYLGWLSLHPEMEDSKELRKNWYSKQKFDIIIEGLNQSGLKF